MILFYDPIEYKYVVIYGTQNITFISKEKYVPTFHVQYFKPNETHKSCELSAKKYNYDLYFVITPNAAINI